MSNKLPATVSVSLGSRVEKRCVRTIYNHMCKCVYPSLHPLGVNHTETLELGKYNNQNKKLREQSQRPDGERKRNNQQSGNGIDISSNLTERENRKEQY